LLAILAKGIAIGTAILGIQGYCINTFMAKNSTVGIAIIAIPTVLFLAMKVLQCSNSNL